MRVCIKQEAHYPKCALKEDSVVSQHIRELKLVKMQLIVEVRGDMLLDF